MRHRNLPKGEGAGSGPAGRISKMRKLVTALIRHERIEGKIAYLDEARGYVELLVQHAHRNGDQHAATMELMDYWILEKDLIPKVFSVLVPRYKYSPAAVTQLHHLGVKYPGEDHRLVVLELKGNPWPPIKTNQRDVSGNLVNVLLDAARKDYRRQKYAEIAGTMTDKTSGSGNGGDKTSDREHASDKTGKNSNSSDVQSAVNAVLNFETASNHNPKSSPGSVTT